MGRRKKTHGRALRAAGLPGAGLEAGTETLRRLRRMSEEGLIILQDSRVKESNYFLATQAGYSMDEVKGTCFASFFDPDSIPAVEAVCAQTSPLNPVASIPKAVLLCKNGDRLDVRLRAGCCRFGGEPAVLVTLRVLRGHVSDSTWGADLDCFFVPEELPFTP